MPRTVVSIKATMRDHTISVPAPENTVAFGIPNACTECHTDKPAAWAVSTLEQWSPRGRRAKLIARAEAFTAARANRPVALDRLRAIVADGAIRGSAGDDGAPRCRKGAASSDSVSGDLKPRSAADHRNS
jgi:hypothetical protein